MPGQGQASPASYHHRQNRLHWGKNILICCRIKWVRVMIKSNIKMTAFFCPFSQAQLHSQVLSLLPQAAWEGGERELGSVRNSSALPLLPPRALPRLQRGALQDKPAPLWVLDSMMGICCSSWSTSFPAPFLLLLRPSRALCSFAPFPSSSAHPAFSALSYTTYWYYFHWSTVWYWTKKFTGNQVSAYTGCRQTVSMQKNPPCLSLLHNEQH